jgi:NAD(P)-dependent dehydrogenase (short-subunit alcohol dehydrogenase family)
MLGRFGPEQSLSGGVMRLKDKVALITGAASGIGQASALKFAREGAKVVAADVQVEENEGTVRTIIAEGGTATSVQADVTKAESIRNMVRTTVETYGRLDILFNNAGIGIRGTILDIDEESFDRIFAVNVKGVFLGCKEAIPVMQSQGGGVILNTASQLGLVGAEASAVYPATKGAIVQLTRCLALDHAADGIRVNSLCPGPIDTPLARSAREQTGDPVAALQTRLASIPLSRIGSPQEMADVAAFLCSDEASFITGAAILADGGWTAR